MKPDWKKLYLDMMAMKAAIESFRSENTELNRTDVDNLLAAARECNVELIALRSALEQGRSRRTPSGKGGGS